MAHRSLYRLFSLALLVVLLTPAAAQARPITQSIPTTPDAAAPVQGPPSPLAAVAGPPSPAGSTSSGGHILFAPAVDVDGTAATNPTPDVPVPVVRAGRQDGGLVVLAAQLQPDDPWHLPPDVPVTFRLWQDGRLAWERTVSSDSWGAASASAVVRDVGADYSYQASAPGYGTTEVRHFRFDPAQASLVLHTTTAQLSYQVLEAGRVRLTLRSPVPLDPANAAVTLVSLRRPLGAADETQTRALPRLDMPLVDSYTAALDIQLPPGDYALGGVVTIRSTPDETVCAAPTRLILSDEGPLPEGPATWISPLEFEAGQHLVRYGAADGLLAFALVPADRLPRIAAEETPQSRFVKTWRTGPFSWEEEHYTLTLEPRVTDGLKTVSLSGFDYDPLARRYDIAIRSWQATAITDTLTVEVYGPGGVVIQREQASVVLPPERTVHYSVEVPAELGQPYGLRVVLDDPVDTIASDLVAAVQQLRMSMTLGELWAEIALTTFILEIDWLAVVYRLPPGTLFLRGPDLPDSIIEWLWSLLDDASDFFIEVGGVTFSVEVGADLYITIDTAACPTPEEQAAAAEALAAWADFINELAAEIPPFFEIDPEIYEPTPYLIVWWFFEGSVGAVLSASADWLTLTLTGSVEASLGGGIGVGIPFGIIDFGDLYKMYRYFWLISKVIVSTAKLANATSDDNSCVPAPPDSRPPDDRQDIWLGIAGFYEAATYTDTIGNLVGWIEIARQQGLWRAERMLTLRLRQVEAARHSADLPAVEAYLDESEVVITVAVEDIRGLYSGTQPITPYQTITEAVAARMQVLHDDLYAMPHARESSAVTSALDRAEQQYMQLRGEELELQQELRALFVADVVGVAAVGLGEAPLSALRSAGVPARLVSLWPSMETWRGHPALYHVPALAPRVLVVSAGGLHEIATSPTARDWLAEYVAGGGRLIVFTQAFGADWAALPGGQVAGVGYEEDQRCQLASVEAAAPSDWLVWMGVERPDVQVDGAFTAWPAGTTILLIRTSGTYAGYPAMIEYPYGQGTVLATAAYGDWAWYSAAEWGDDWPMTRAILLRAWLLARGQDVADVVTADPSAWVTVTLALTNSSALTTTNAQVNIPTYPSAEPHTTLPLTLAPGAGAIVTVTLPTPARFRGVHSWTQVGLYRLRQAIWTARGSALTTWGPVLHVRSPLPPVLLNGTLRAAQAEALFAQTVAVTATVANYDSVAHTVVLVGERDLPAGPVTLTVPAGGQAVHIYTVTMDASKAPTVRFSGGGVRPERLSTAIHLSPYPNVWGEPVLPPALDDGALLLLPLTNRSPAAALSATVSLSLTTPTGATMWSATTALPSLAPGEKITPTFVLGLPLPLELGTYTLHYRITDGYGRGRTEQVPLSAEPAVAWSFDHTAYQVRETLYLTATVSNPGRFHLYPQATIAVPDAGVSTTQSLDLPAGAAVQIPLAVFLPAGLVAGDHDAQLALFQGATHAHHAAFSIPPSWIGAELEPGPYQAGSALTVMLQNLGGVDTTATYTLRLMGEWGALAQGSGSVPVAAGAAAPVTLTIPAQAISGDRYALWAYVQDAGTGRSDRTRWPLTVDGISVTVQVQAERPTYTTGETVTLTGMLTVSSGTIPTLPLSLWVYSWVPAVPSNQRLPAGDDNCPDVKQAYPSLAVDTAGSAYALWQDFRYDQLNGDLFFAYRPAGGEWQPGVRVNHDYGSASQVDSAIAVDLAGNAYAIWDDGRDGNWSIYFSYRPVGDSWWYDVRVNDDPGTANQYVPAIAMDASGTAYAVWEDERNGNSDIFFSYLPPEGEWQPNVKINDDVGSADQHSPSIVADTAGNLYVAWEDDRNGNADIYVAYRPAGGAWQPNVKASDDPGAAIQEEPAIGLDAAGNTYLLWGDSRSGNYDMYFAYRPAGGAWQPSVKVNDDAGTAQQYGPALAVDAAGNAYATWQDLRSGTDEIYFSYRPAGGAWQANVKVNDGPPAGWRAGPAIAVDGSGTAYAVWTDDRSGLEADIYFSYRPAGGSWQSNTRANVVNTGTNLHEYADILVDAERNVYLAWSEWDCDTVYIESYFASRSWRGTWSPAVTLGPPHGSYDKYESAIAVDPAGNAYGVWEDNRGGNWDIYFSSRPAGGSWSTAVRVNDVTTNRQTSPDIAVDAAGNAYAVWSDWRASSYNVYFSYRPAGGAWQANVRVNDVLGSTYYPYAQIAVDAAGNAYAVWEDNRNSDLDIYFSYRPAGGAWQANERVNDDVGLISQSDSAISLDAAGNAYAVWDDPRSGMDEIYFAYRPVGGPWGPNSRIMPYSTGVEQTEPAIAVNAAGDAYAVWIDNRYGTNDVFLARRPAGGSWGAVTQVTDRPGTDLRATPAVAIDYADNAYVAWTDDRLGTEHIYYTILAFDSYWWHVDWVYTSTTWPIDETVGRLGEIPGKYLVSSMMSNALGQSFGRDESTFYLYPPGAAVSLRTGQDAYRPGEPIVISGRVTNTAITTDTIALTVTANAATVLTQTLALGPGVGAPYAVTLTATTDLRITATADMALAVEQALVYGPYLEATMQAPSVVGRAPFTVTLGITNPTGVETEVELNVYAGLPTGTAALPLAYTTTLLLPPSSRLWYAFPFTLAEEGGLTVDLRGDFSLTLAQPITQGEIVALALPGEELRLRAGSVTLPYTLTGSGALPTPVEISATLSGPVPCTWTRSLVVLSGQVLTGEIALPAGLGLNHARVALYGAQGNELAHQEASFWVLEEAAPESPAAHIVRVEPWPQPVAAGRPLTLTLALRNEGAAGPVTVGWQAFDVEQQAVVTLTTQLTPTIVVTLSVPADVPAGAYFGQASLDGQTVPFTLAVAGADVALGLALDQPWYRPGDAVHLTVALTETGGLGGDYNLSLAYLSAEDYVTVTVPAGTTVYHTFTFTATGAGRASVNLANAPSAAGHRTLVIDSLPVAVVRPATGAYLTMDRPVYHPGETIAMDLTITRTLVSAAVLGPMELFWRGGDVLLWQAPFDADSMRVLTGTYPLSFTLPPDLATGRYTFMVQTDGQDDAYPVDVHGWTVTARRLTLDQFRYAAQDTLSATVEFVNEDDTSIPGLRLFAWVAPPRNGRGLLFTPSVSRTVDLRPGLNVFTVTGAFSTSFAGPHRLVVNLGGCCGWRVAGAAAQFDVGWFQIQDLRTDHGDYAPGAPGVGMLDVYGYGPTHLVVTATNGATLLDIQPELAGFATFNFTVPTTPTGDYLLVAQGTDQDGLRDTLTHAYAVPEPSDTQPPTLTLWEPASHTVIVSPAPTATVAVRGMVQDDRGVAYLSVNGQAITPTAGGLFTASVEIVRGPNQVAVVALDTSTNVTFTFLPVLLLPASGVALTVDRTQAWVGEQVTFQGVLTASGAVSHADLVQIMPAEMVTDVVASATAGQTRVWHLFPGWYTINWQGSLSATQPVTVQIAATLIATGTLTETATAYWGWGLHSESNAAAVHVGSPACLAPLDQVGIAGPTQGWIEVPYTFTAVITPADATAPVTYTWEPAPAAGQGTGTATYLWTLTGTQAITVTAQNCGGTVVDGHGITLLARRWFVYLPLVSRPN